MRQRILQGAAAKLAVTLADQDGSPADAAGAVTVTVTRANGTVLLPAGTAVTHGGTGAYSVALTAAQTATLDLLTAVWADAGDGSVTTTAHEVVGGYFFSLSEARHSNDGLLEDPAAYSNEHILAARQEVEDEAERICDVAFVPRYARAVLTGQGTAELVLPGNRIRAVRSVRVYPVVGGALYTAFTATQLAGLTLGDDGTIRRTDYGVFDEGHGNVVVEWEHGWDAPPAEVKRAALRRLQSRLNFSKSSIAERTVSFTGENGQTYQLATPSAYRTGIPDVDAAYERYSYREQVSSDTQPASRPLILSPQRNSVFHSGRRS